MEELENRFGMNLCLSEKERESKLRKRNVGTCGRVHRLDDVSIKEIGNHPFLVRFCNKKDKLPDMEPWTFRDSLVVLVDARAGLDTREVEFHHSTYWIQLHGILPLNMTTMVAQKIGSLVGKVLEVDQADGVECMGRFLQYEFLPEYCFVCGHLGHPSRIYIEKLEADQDLTESKVEVLHNFSGLEAVEDLSSWRLRFLERNVSRGNNSTSSGGRWRHERSSRLGEPRHLQQVGCWWDVEQERERRIREEAWKVGLLGPHGRNARPTQGDSSTNQYMQEEEGGDPSDRGHGLRIGLGLLTQSSDSFNLGLIIEGTMQRHEYRKTNRGGEDNDGCSGEERIPPTLELCSLTYEGKKARRHQMLTVALLQEA
ncbi:unnamed protein product [Prunus armeniaca]